MSLTLAASGDKGGGAVRPRKPLKNCLQWSTPNLAPGRRRKPFPDPQTASLVQRVSVVSSRYPSVSLEPTAPSEASCCADLSDSRSPTLFHLSSVFARSHFHVQSHQGGKEDVKNIELRAPVCPSVCTKNDSRNNGTFRPIFS